MKMSMLDKLKMPESKKRLAKEELGSMDDMAMEESDDMAALPAEEMEMSEEAMDLSSVSDDLLMEEMRRRGLLEEDMAADSQEMM